MSQDSRLVALGNTVFIKLFEDNQSYAADYPLPQKPSCRTEYPLLYDCLIKFNCYRCHIIGFDGSLIQTNHPFGELIPAGFILEEIAEAQNNWEDSELSDAAGLLLHFQGYSTESVTLVKRARLDIDRLYNSPLPVFRQASLNFALQAS